jgi:3-hydroxyacyl-[acyl-carrier-protein] dehydratase
VAGKDLIVDPAQLDFDHIVADLDEIRRYNPQRYEMEQITAIIADDFEAGICVGYKDVTDEEFWVRGHMPGMSLMPGVIMCEIAAQLCSYHASVHDLLGEGIVGFGGLDDVRFRGLVRPGDRLVIACKKLKVRRSRMITCLFQAFVDTSLVCEGQLRGILLPKSALPES